MNRPLTPAFVLLGFGLLSHVCLTGLTMATPVPKDARRQAKEGQNAGVDEKAIRALLAQLGDEEYENREAAQKRLTAIGEPALPLLEEAARAHPDLETRNRAKQVVVAINRAFLAEVRRFEGGPVSIKDPWANRIAVTLDGRFAVATLFDGLRSWDIETGKETVTFDWPANTGYSWTVCISPDARHVLVGSNDRIVRLMDFKTGKLIRQFTGHTDIMRGTAFMKDGKTTLTCSYDKSIRQWDMETGKQIRAFEDVPDAVRCMAVSPDEKIIAGGNFSYETDVATVRLWNFETGKQIRAMKGHKREITSVAFTPDGNTLLSCSMDGQICLWDVATGKLQKTMKGHKGRVLNATFTPDGKRVISCGDELDKTLRIWDAATGKELLQSVECAEAINFAAALPDGKRCVTASYDGIVRLWEWKR